MNYVEFSTHWVMKKAKAVGLEKEVYEKLDVIRNRYSVELGFVMSYSQTVAYVTRDIK